MIKKKSTIIILIIVLTTLFYYVLSPIKTTAEENKAQTTEQWEDSDFMDPTRFEETAFHRLVDSTIFNSKLYVASGVSIDNGESAQNKIFVQAYNGESWENIGTPIISKADQLQLDKISFCKKGENELYLFYISEGLLEVSKLNTNNNTWSEVTSLSDVSNDFDITSDNDEVYMTILNQNGDISKLFKFDGTNLNEIATLRQNAGYLGKTKVTILKDSIYIAIKEPGKINISLYQYKPSENEIKEIEDCEVNLFNSEYEMVTVLENTREKLYITSTQTENVLVHTYDGTNFAKLEESGLPQNLYILSISSRDGELYITGLLDGKLQTYTHNRNNNTFLKEGLDIENISPEVAQAIEFNNNIYTLYIPPDEEEIKIKRKSYIKITLKGDIDGDNRVTTKDAILGAKGLAKITTLSEKQIAAGDINGDKRLSTSDLILISKFLAKIINSL